MNELHLELPFAGSRMLRDLLNAEGLTIGRYGPALEGLSGVPPRSANTCGLRGVSALIMYDNTKLAVKRIPGDGRQHHTRTSSDVQ